MKDFFNVMEKDIQKDEFSPSEYLMWGIIAPFVFLIIVGVAGSIIG